MDFKILAKIGKGTKRKKRDINLLEVAEEMKSLYTIHQSLDKVAKIVKLSPEMVRQFLKINELDESVKELIKNDLIKGVDIGYRVSKLSKKDQIIFAKHIIEKNISSKDVRAIVRYKIDNSKMPVEKAINEVIQSKDKKIYVAYLGIEEDTYEKLLEKNREHILMSIFNNVIPRESIISFEINGRVVIAKVLKEGLQEMRNKAKNLNVPLAKLADALVKEHLGGNK
ncbi:MAG: hypothetical protein AB1401_00925 [Thermodesulfobacteriota bacterium]